jgi:uncharacterized protein (TIGR03086 family)
MTGHAALVRRATEYALGAVDAVRPELLTGPTPCSKWNLHMLLRHASASVAALREGLGEGRVLLFAHDDDTSLADPAGCARARLLDLVDAWAAADDVRVIAVADRLMPLPLLAGAAALEIAVHGWDVYQASGTRRPIPAELAAELLGLCPALIPENNRQPLFAAPTTAPANADACERLLAYLGRAVTG